MAAFVRQVRSEVVVLTNLLRDAGWNVARSEANFVTATGPAGSACEVQSLAAQLLREGIKIRVWPKDPERDTLVRVTCPGDPQELDTLVAAMRGALDSHTKATRPTVEAIEARIGPMRNKQASQSGTTGETGDARRERRRARA